MYKFLDPLEKFNWFNVLITAAVLIILMAAGGKVMMHDDVDLLALACAVFLLLALPVLYKLVSRRPAKERPVHISFAPKNKR